jgi:hypothetical protein
MTLNKFILWVQSNSNKLLISLTLKKTKMMMKAITKSRKVNN